MLTFRALPVGENQVLVQEGICRVPDFALRGEIIFVLQAHPKSAVPSPSGLHFGPPTRSTHARDQSGQKH